jgi:hypothetical protein
MYYILYKTINLVNNKTYIGIHQTKNINDGYLGSGLAMRRAIKKYGEDTFKREILEFCSSYEELLEREKVYVNEDWVNEETNYNLKTGGQSAGLLSEESKNKISETLKDKYKSGEIKPRIGPRPDDFNSWNKDIKTGPRTNDSVSKQSLALKEYYKTHEHNSKGVEPWNKGIETGPMSEKQKGEISKTLKKRYQTVKHPRKDKPSWNSGKTGVQEAWNKGIKMEQVECPHCGKLIDSANGKRWHFDNCKYNNLIKIT